MAEHEAKDKEEQEEARRRKKPQSVYDQLKQAAEPEESKVKQAIAELPMAEQASLVRNPQLQGAQRAEAMLEFQQTYGNKYVQRLAGSNKEATLDEGIIRRIEAQRGSGKPLEPEVRSQMEASFGHDFSEVKIHTDAEANRLSNELSAKAFTTGRDIFFKAGTYKPNCEGGVELIAHELTHVIQQDKVAEGMLLRKADGEEGQESAPTMSRNSLALYDANRAHMREGSEDAQLGEFQKEAVYWAGWCDTTAIPVVNDAGIRTAIQDASAAGRIDTIACFGHGSSRAGWRHMPEFRKILVENAGAGKFSPSLRVILYMCLTGAEPGLEESGKPGEEAVEPGGVNSFAAGLRSDLHGAGLTNVEVWAHTRREHTTQCPHWRVFGPLGEGRSPEGEPFFTRVFDQQFMDGLHQYMVNNREQLAREGGELGDLLMRGHQIASVYQINESYRRGREKELLFGWYRSHCAGQRAMWAPMVPDDVARELRTEWLREHRLTEEEVRGASATPPESVTTEAGQRVQTGVE